MFYIPYQVQLRMNLHAEVFSSEIVTLLSSLGISNEIFKKKQKEHFETIINATTDIQSAIILLSSKNLQSVVQTLDHVGGSESRRLRFVEDLAIKGLEDSDVQRKIRHLQEHEMSLAINKRGEEKVRILIPESRRLYGVCDDSGVLKEGQVFVRVQVPRKVIPLFLPGYLPDLCYVIGFGVTGQCRRYHCAESMPSSRRYPQTSRGGPRKQLRKA